MLESESFKTVWRVSVQYMPTSRPNKRERRFIFEGHSRVHLLKLTITRQNT